MLVRYNSAKSIMEQHSREHAPTNEGENLVFLLHVTAAAMMLMMVADEVLDSCVKKQIVLLVLLVRLGGLFTRNSSVLQDS